MGLGFHTQEETNLMKDNKEFVPTYWDIKEKVTKLWEAHRKSRRRHRKVPEQEKK